MCTCAEEVTCVEEIRRVAGVLVGIERAAAEEGCRHERNDEHVNSRAVHDRRAPCAGSYDCDVQEVSEAAVAAVVAVARNVEEEEATYSHPDKDVDVSVGGKEDKKQRSEHVLESGLEKEMLQLKELEEEVVGEEQARGSIGRKKKKKERRRGSSSRSRKEKKERRSKKLAGIWSEG